MNKIQKSIISTGFVIFSSMVIFSIQQNDIFAVEYDTFTSDTYGIKFQKPLDWHYEYNNDFKSAISEEDDDYSKITNAVDEIKIVDRNPSKNDDRYLFVHVYDGVEGQNLQTFTTNNMNKELEFYEDAGWITDIIKQPTPVKIGNLLMGTYTLHVKSADEDQGDDEMTQIWTILKGNRGYAFEFTTHKNEFNRAENTEVRNHFIESIKFR